MSPSGRFRLGPFLERWWPAFLAGGTALGLLNFFYFWLDDVVRAQATEPGPILVEELTAAYGTAILLPGIIWAAHRWPLHGPTWLRRLPRHVAGVCVYSGLKTTWNWATRTLLFPLFEWGAYDYGEMPMRYLMELPSDTILYATVLPVTYLVVHWRQAKDQEVTVSRLEAGLAEARLSALRAQMQPHFLFNTLNTISSVMYEDVDAADSMVTRLSDLLRRAMAVDGEQTVPLREDLEFLTTYLDLMKGRFGDQLDVAIQIPTELQDCQVPPLLLQPLLENAFRHGTPASAPMPRIEIRAVDAGDTVRVHVADNGPGFTPDFVRRFNAGLSGGGRRHGIGLSNVKARLDELYGSRARLCLNSTGNGALVTVEIPKEGNG